MWFLSSTPVIFPVFSDEKYAKLHWKIVYLPQLKWDLTPFTFWDVEGLLHFLQLQILPAKEHSLIMPCPTLLHNFPFIFLLLLCIYCFFWGINSVPPYQAKLAICAFNCIHSYIFQNLAPLSTTHPNPTFLHPPHIFISSMSTGFFYLQIFLLILKKPSPDMRSS